MITTKSKSSNQHETRSPAGKASLFFSTKDDRIPLSAWAGMAAFLGLLYVLMLVGSIAGF